LSLHDGDALYPDGCFDIPDGVEWYVGKLKNAQISAPIAA